MTEIEILKKIIEQDCDFIGCRECPLDGVCGDGEDLLFKAKELLTKLKGKIMTEIDLIKPFILDKPIKCWVKNCGEETWCERWLKGKSSSGYYYAINNISHNTIPTDEQFAFGAAVWQQCTLTDPNKPKTRLMTQEEYLAWACTEGSTGWQVSYNDSTWEHPSRFPYTGDFEAYQRRTVQWNNGKPIYGEPMDFTMEVEE